MTGGGILQPLAAAMAERPDARTLAELTAEAWVDLVTLAHRHRLVPALHHALQELGPDAPVPAEVRAHAAGIAALNDTRNAAVRDEIRTALAVLNAAGLEPTLLKGAALLMGDSLQGRMVGDIDMLIPPAQEADALAALDAAGFRIVGEYPASSHSVADFDRPGSPACLDLHRDLLDPPFRHLLPASAMLARTEAREEGGLRWRVPEPTDHALHTLLHAQILAAGYYGRRLDLGAAREFAALRGQIDWARIETWADHHRMRPVLDSMLLAARDGFGMAWPLRTPPGAVAIAHHRRASAIELHGGSWDSGLGPLARLRESLAPDRLDAMFGTGRGLPARLVLLVAGVTRRHRLRDILRRLMA